MDDNQIKDITNRFKSIRLYKVNNQDNNMNSLLSNDIMNKDIEVELESKQLIFIL